MAAATLLTLDIVLPGGMVEGTGTLTEARTMAFTTLVLAQLFNCFNARSERVSAFHNLFTNPLLWGAIALSLVLQAAVVYLPFLNRPFGTTALAAGAWLVCVAMASTVLWANEIRKLAGRWRRKAASAAARQEG
jgi:magnesium-transporting ATPase (P-type)